MGVKINFEEFKEKLKNDNLFRGSITTKSDVVDFDNGIMIISHDNIDKYLERYMCKDEFDLQDTLWYNYGVYVKIVD